MNESAMLRNALAYTVFPDVKAQSPERHNGTWGDLVALLESPPSYHSKTACPLLKLATFGDVRSAKGSLRWDDNLTSITGLVGDYDAGAMSIDAAAATLAAFGIEAFLYTSASHTTLVPRWRVLVPLSTPVDPGEHWHLMSVLNELLGGVLAHESFTASQTYYFGRVAGVDYQTRHVPGVPLDAISDAFTGVGPADRPVAAPRVPLAPGSWVDAARVAGVTEDTVEEIRAALAHLSDQATDRVTWIARGQNLKCLGDLGLQLWSEFSRFAEDPDDDDELERRWDGLSGTASDYRAVFAEAQRYGWVNPKSRGAVVVQHAEDRAIAGQAFYEHQANILTRVSNMPELEAAGLAVSADARVTVIERKALAADILNRSKELMSSRTGIGQGAADKLVRLRMGDTDRARQEQQRQMSVALNYSPAAVTPRVMSVPEMVDELVYISRGKMVANINERHSILKFDEFQSKFAASVYEPDDGKPVENAILWARSDQRKTVDTRTFRAGESVFTTDPDGVPAVNLWRPIVRKPQVYEISPFLDHIDYLFGTDAPVFLDWLAHIEQKPGELPHFGWLHIAKRFGTGRNWLACVLARVWRGYMAPSVDMAALIGGNYNGQLAGRLLAQVDEIREGGKESAYTIEGRIRGLLTEPQRLINPKYGGQYTEYNACRWLVYSNHDNPIPMGDGDRRWWVAKHSDAPRSPETYAYLYSLLAIPDWIESVGAYLAERDISAFLPGQTPPASDAKTAAIEASKSDYRKAADEIVKYWPSDFISRSDVRNIMGEGNSATKVNDAAVRHAMLDAGATPLAKTVWVPDGKKERVWTLRNQEMWDSGFTYHSTTEEAKKSVKKMGESAYDLLLSKIE